MATSKKPFKLKLLGLFSLETETEQTISFAQIMIIIGMVMIFLIVIAFVFKWYAVPLFTGAGSIGKAGAWVSKFIKSRSP